MADATASPRTYPARTWAEVDLGRLRENTRALARVAAPARLMAVVKADGYGHGAVPAARAALEGGASALAVARPDEAIPLRDAGIEAPVLVFAPASPEEVDLYGRLHLTATVVGRDQAAALARAAREQGVRLAAHVKVDTGMGRLGFLPDEALAFWEELRGLEGLELEGLYTHFATADEPEAAYARLQWQRFRGLVDHLEARGVRPPLVHAANSAALLRMPEARLDLVRAGIALYGVRPPNTPPRTHLAPALTWKCRVSTVRTLPPGWGVSYGKEFVAWRPSRVATLAVGYADGYRRSSAHRAQVLLQGRRVPLIGRVTMDQVMVDVTELDGDPGSEAVLLGGTGPHAIEPEEVAAWMETIPYEVFTGLSARVERRYV
ncbi:alanine racemase [Limnochorda pilosa]|uniref:Alanine racemase n=1 Tax=Limnochorda pilosa TaxID=1555112 RepID=A0A0K2SJ21_LIMPI|nr:alanine racemase [Limnochorda pilosa]BAS27121.1 alanine racemase [Limnochorda pilosa]